MQHIKYISDSKGKRVGVVIDFEIGRKTLKGKKALEELMENIQDILAVELSKGEKSLPYGEARKQIFRKGK